MRVPWTARRSNQSILKEIGPGCSLEGLMLKLKLQYFGNLMPKNTLASVVAQMVKNEPATQETYVQSLVGKISLEKEMASHSNILAWRIPWTVEPGDLQSTGSQRVRHD